LVGHAETSSDDIKPFDSQHEARYKVIRSIYGLHLEVENAMAAAPDEMTQYDWFGQARIHEITDDYESALQAYEKALEIDPSFAKAWYYKAKLHHQLGQKSDALKCGRKALELKPDWESHLRKFLPDL
jgi:tetratricopeptide (TPR) repeat protein